MPEIDKRHQLTDEARIHAPVFLDEDSRTFLLTRFADGRALLNDGTLWKDADQAEEGSLVRTFKPTDMNRPGDRNSSMGWMDNPEHARVRPPIAMALNRRVARLKPVVEEIVRERLDAVQDQESFDLVTDFTVPIPIAVIGRILGVDTSDMPQFRAWSEAAIGVFSRVPTPEQQAATRAASDAMSDFLDQVMAERRRVPQDDLVSDLLAVQAQSGALSDSEIRVNCMNLLLGGNVTTADLIGNAAWLLLTHPAQLAKLKADPGLIAAAIEETLRFEPPTDGIQRVASREMEMHGCPVHAHQVVAVLIYAANRDPEAFPNPHVFDITRKDGPHLAFGGGAHLCIGAALARLEAQVAVASLFARFPDLRLADPSAPPDWRDMAFIHGMASLAVRP